MVRLIYLLVDNEIGYKSAYVNMLMFLKLKDVPTISSIVVLLYYSSVLAMPFLGGVPLLDVSIPPWISSNLFSPQVYTYTQAKRVSADSLKLLIQY